MHFLEPRPRTHKHFATSALSRASSPKELGRAWPEGMVATRSGKLSTPQLQRANSSRSSSNSSFVNDTAVTGKGHTVPKDIHRRSESTNDVDRPLQLAILAFFALPLAWAVQTQQNPTAKQQVTNWARASYAQLTDGKINLNFQVACAALFVERICYTWVHTYSQHFVRFTKTRLGRSMGNKPLEVVWTIFCLNKVLQLGTFVLWYNYVINFSSPFGPGLFSLENVTRLQWVLFVQGAIFGQILNAAIYRAIGKAGVYYGYRLGEKVPWVCGFPFSVMSHPQYTGVCLSVIGVNQFIATPTHVAAGWFNLTAIQILFYVYMAIVEDYL